MFEKVNPQHPDKVADRIAGAIVDLCYTKSEWPKVAAEVLLGHGLCSLQIETSERLTQDELEAIVHRIAGEEVEVRALIVPQDVHLADNQAGAVRCGDNGIFRGCAPTHEQKLLTTIATSIYDRYPTDGKYIIRDITDNSEFDGLTAQIREHQTRMRDLNSMMAQMLDIRNCEERPFTKDESKQWDKYTSEFNEHHKAAHELLRQREKSQQKTAVTVCQSHMPTDDNEALAAHLKEHYGIAETTINPLGPWTGGTDVDCGATNRKLGSDMGDGVTGGGLHGKDLSKADVSVNIWAYLESIRTGREVTACCSIGDETVCGIPYRDIVEQARLYIHTLGGFERFAEWGLIRHCDK